MTRPLLAVALVLAACTGIDPQTRRALDRADPMTADVSAIAVAVDIDAGLPLRPLATLTLAARRRDGEQLEDSFVLEQLRTETATRQRVVFRVAPDDVPRLEALRAQVLAWKAADPDGVNGSLSVKAGACATGPLPAGPLRVDTFLQLDAADGFLPLLRGLDLRRLAPAGVAAPTGCDGNNVAG